MENLANQRIRGFIADTLKGAWNYKDGKWEFVGMFGRMPSDEAERFLKQKLPDFLEELTKLYSEDIINESRNGEYAELWTDYEK